MQRRKPVDYSSSARSNYSQQSSTPTKKHHVLPTTVNNATNGKIMIKAKQQKKKMSTVSCLVQTICFLMIATSVMLIYIAARRKGANNNINLNNQFSSNSSTNAVVTSDIKNGYGSNHISEIRSNSQIEERFPDVIEHNTGDDFISAEQNTNIDNTQISTPRKRRTTEEANAYMAQQPSFSVDGEKALKKELLSLYNLQQKSLEKLSPIVTRWIGERDENGEKMKYWLPKSTTSEEVLHAWEMRVEKMKDEMRKKDIEYFPLLHGIKDTQKVKDAVEKRKKGTTSHEVMLPINQSNISSSQQFPDPSPEGTHVVLKPTFGTHRENVDAVFALAEGYDLKIYLLFIESLKATGFNGDLVLSVSALESLKPGVEEYLRSNQLSENQSGVNVVAYAITWKCYDDKGEVADGANEGVRKCELVGMYGEDADEHVVPDTREPRPVATARFELYWAWSQYYNEENWIMLIDSRDAHFQLNPFEGLSHTVDGDRGQLYFFAENSEVSNIGKSKFNSRWLKDAYGTDNVQHFMDKPIICSGSTMGQQIAMQPYLRAMVAQFDETNCKLKGCDQGFHNYLYYSNALVDLKGIKEVKVFEQGTGIINNLGVLRIKPLREWGILDEKINVLNWDGSISAVAHQFDRDDELNKHLKEVRKGYEDQFHTKKDKSSSSEEKHEDLKKQHTYNEFLPPAPTGTHVIMKPTFGKHRPHVDAIFGLAEGYDLRIYLLFIESLKETGFNGDLVLSVSALGSLKQGVEEYLRSHQKDENEDGLNVVVYTVTWNCFNSDGSAADGAKEGMRMCNLVGLYGNDTDNEAIPDPREPRPVATARFELYWAWSQYYEKHNWIMLIDTRDAHFQLNPFATLDHSDNEEHKDDGLLYFFAENSKVGNIGKSSFNSRWLKSAYGSDNVQQFMDKPIICSGSTMGQQIAMQQYLQGMIAQFDKTQCKLKGCDQGFHNYLYYSNALVNLKGIREVVEFAQGTGIINNLGVLRTKPLREWGILDDKTRVLNWDGSVSAVAHQFDRDDELNKHLKEVRQGYANRFWAEKK